MQISALIKVLNYLKEISGDPGLLTKYKNLLKVITEAINNPNGDFSVEILAEKNSLKNFLMESHPIEWGYTSYRLFESINTNKLFGKPAADHLENMITAADKDYRAMFSDLSQRMVLISTFSENLNQFRQLFELIVPAELFQLAEDNKNKSSLLLFFEGRLAVQNIADLERYSRLWDGILGTFSRLTGEDNLSLDISNISNGNIVLEVALEDKTLNSIMTGVVGILSSLPDILKIRKIQLELAQLPLYNNLIELLEEEIQTLVSIISYTTAQKLITNYYDDVINASEIINDLSRSLKQILSFVEKSGKMESRSILLSNEGGMINKKIIESISLANELDIVTSLLARTLKKRESQIDENEAIERMATSRL